MNRFLPVKVSRIKGLTGAVKVELILPEHVRGVMAEPVLIRAEDSAGQLTLRFAGDGLGPFNQPAVIRATLNDASGPVIAETKVEIVGEGS